MYFAKISATSISCNSNCAQARVQSKNCNTYNTNWLFEKVIIIKVSEDTFPCLYYNLLVYRSGPIPICELCALSECSIPCRLKLPKTLIITRMCRVTRVLSYESRIGKYRGSLQCV